MDVMPSMWQFVVTQRLVRGERRLNSTVYLARSSRMGSSHTPGGAYVEERSVFGAASIPAEPWGWCRHGPVRDARIVRTGPDAEADGIDNGRAVLPGQD